MVSSVRRSQGTPGGPGEVVLLWVCIGAVALVLGTTWCSAHLTHALAGGRAVPMNPFTLLFDLIAGHVAWTGAMTGFAAAILAIIFVLAVVVVMAVIRHHRRLARVDKAAGHMGRGRHIEALSAKAAGQKAHRLGVEGKPGLVIGRAISGGRVLYQDWETCSIDIAGPRTGKTSARVIPAIIAAPGAVVATSNKRDLVDGTRDLRAERGPVWVFDPQALVDEPVDWWWNPLSYVTDETRAQNLAGVFSAASVKAGARTDAYFDSAANNLLANFLLAAAVGGLPITQVYQWLSDSNDDTPAQLLDRHGYTLLAGAVRGVVGLSDKQRGGIYGGAVEKVSFLTNRQAVQWVTPPQHSSTRQFHPEEFVRTTGTLYSLSKEGHGSAGPLVTALTVAVCEAAEEYAKTCPGGRLSVPMVAVLDEAANVCRWPELPNLYSHYGSRGVNVMTFLQSWSQGVDVWGREGMQKLWSAANVKVYGGGVSEVDFLEQLSKLIGPYEHLKRSISRSTRERGSSSSLDFASDQILDVADLGALDRGRLIVLGAGAVPTLARSLPWFTGPDKKKIEASFAAHDGSQRHTATGNTQPTAGPVSGPSDGANPWLS